MTTTQPTAHPYDSALRWPDGTDVRAVDWHQHWDEATEDVAWTAAEVVDVEHDGQTFDVVAEDGMVRGIVVEGTFYDGDDIRTMADEEADTLLTTPTECPDPESRAEGCSGGTGCPEWEAQNGELMFWQRARDMFDDGDAPDSAEGPMMNYFYVLEEGRYWSRSVDLAEWAAKLDGLPLCAVTVGEDAGLALTGGGMDLSWEIAEAHLRLGYRPPQWLRLPEMGGRGRSEADQAIVRAVVRTQRDVAWRANREASIMVERYGKGVDVADD